MFLSVVAQTLAQNTVQNKPSKEKIAVIFSGQFSDEANGISEYSAAVKQFESLVKPRHDELHRLLEKLQPYLDGKVRDPENHRAYIDNPPMSAAQKLEFRNLGEEYSIKINEYRQAQTELSTRFIDPIFTKIKAAMEQFRLERGYEKLIDAGCRTCSPTVKGEDVTDEFIAFYNKSNKKPDKPLN